MSDSINEIEVSPVEITSGIGYAYDLINFFYLYDAHIDIVDGIPVYPDGVTAVAPSKENRKGFKEIFNVNENKWVFIEDHVGEVAYNKLFRSKITITALGPIPNELTLIAPPEQFTYWYMFDDTSSSWIVNPTYHEAIVNEAIETANQMRLTESSSVFTYLDKEMDADAISRQYIQGAAALAKANSAFTTDWICADNSVITLNAEQIIGLELALYEFGGTIHQKYRILKDQISSMSDADLINWLLNPVSVIATVTSKKSKKK